MKSLLLKIFILCFFLAIIACSPDKRIVGKYVTKGDFQESYEFFKNNKIIYRMKISEDDDETETEYKWKKENGRYYIKWKMFEGKYAKEWDLFDIEYISPTEIRVKSRIYYYSK